MIFIVTEYQKSPLLFLVIYHSETKQVPIDVVVENSVLNTPPVIYRTHMVYRGILLGAMKSLMDSNENFK